LKGIILFNIAVPMYNAGARLLRLKLYSACIRKSLKGVLEEAIISWLKAKNWSE
jgi:hypothetical protein